MRLRLLLLQAVSYTHLNITYDKASGKKMYDFGDGASTSATRNWMSMANPIGTLI